MAKSAIVGLDVERFGPSFVTYGKSPHYIQPHYDDIVDRSSFTPGSTLMDMQDTDNASAGVFDYPDGVVKEPVNPVLVAIRSGKLEQPDIDKLMSALEQVTKSQLSAEEREAAQKQIDEINKLRQSAVDDILGVDSESESK